MQIFSDAFGFDVGEVRELIWQGEEERAVAYLEQFIAKGSILAMIEMAEYLLDKGDSCSSLSWMEKAERAIGPEDFDSLLYLSGALRRGLGAGTAKERYFRAFDLKERVAEAGHLGAIREMIVNYAHGLNGAARDPDRAIYWVKKAAALNDEEAKQILRDEGPQGGS
ncbi:sel1 repeat family protein [Bradyrhizobium aeschynomenes]|uniref:sel1 repeat family protein n=1 Tax=Bradyrhizobium aeschynomenes TaxID=2734909 RepID=UPI001553A840|nr:sel1 repeat family protein [Bradyrhizobium aeschynomenes]NPV21122.1 sel1 repeat family protein [Bradyrhizobium aeschynomenes]